MITVKFNDKLPYPDRFNKENNSYFTVNFQKDIDNIIYKGAIYQYRNKDLFIAQIEKTHQDINVLYVPLSGVWKQVPCADYDNLNLIARSINKDASKDLRFKIEDNPTMKILANNHHGSVPYFYVYHIAENDTSELGTKNISWDRILIFKKGDVKCQYSISGFVVHLRRDFKVANRVILLKELDPMVDELVEAKYNKVFA